MSDWTDAFTNKNKRQCIPAILFLYFACLAPVVSFGTIASQITEGSMGVVEFLIASGGAGMVSSILLVIRILTYMAFEATKLSLLLKGIFYFEWTADDIRCTNGINVGFPFGVV